jgi:hypothetical protein
MRPGSPSRSHTPKNPGAEPRSRIKDGHIQHWETYLRLSRARGTLGLSNKEEGIIHEVHLQKSEHLRRGCFDKGKMPCRTPAGDEGFEGGHSWALGTDGADSS